MFVVTSMSHNSETTNTPSWSRKPRHQDLLQSNPPYALPPVLILLEITAYSAVSHRTITWQIVVNVQLRLLNEQVSDSSISCAVAVYIY